MRMTKSLADAHYRPATAFSGCCRDCWYMFHAHPDWVASGHNTHFCEANTTARKLCANVAPMMVCDKFEKNAGSEA